MTLKSVDAQSWIPHLSSSLYSHCPWLFPDSQAIPSACFSGYRKEGRERRECLKRVT